MYIDAMTTSEQIAQRTAEIAAEMNAAGLDSTTARMFAERELADAAGVGRDERRLEGEVS